MDCPFCAEVISDEALVCKHCNRDLRFALPLLTENEDLIAQLDELQNEAVRLREQIKHGRNPLLYWTRQFVLFVLPAIILLLIAHYVIVFILDQKTLYLRVVSMVVPLPFGFALNWFANQTPVRVGLLGFLGALTAVFAMATVTGFHDDVPILPDSVQDVREFIEYSLSIALAMTTGGIFATVARSILPKSMSSKRAPNPAAMQLAVMLGPHLGKRALNRRAVKIEAMFNTVGALGGALATAMGSIYTGVRFLFFS
jgi:hypothetical protein